MQLSLPSSVLAANHDVRGALYLAHTNVAAAQSRLEASPSAPAATRRLVSDALEAARQAVDGVEALGAANLLDGTFQRYAVHSVRHLEQAASMLDRPGRLDSDGLAILTKTIFDAEVATRLGTEAGDRSLANPSPKALERATEFGGGETGDGGPVWVDGAWLDGLGNPVRGGDSGPDDIGSGWDGAGERGDDGGYTGPDGESYTGI